MPIKPRPEDDVSPCGFSRADFEAQVQADWLAMSEAEQQAAIAAVVDADEDEARPIDRNRNRMCGRRQNIRITGGW